MQLFYNPEISGNTIELSEEESKHCTRVLRLKIDDIVWITNGKGTLYKTSIIDDHQKACVLTINEKFENYGSRPFKLHIAISPLQHADRLEWFLEKATEAGIDEITPILCERSERRNVNIERLQKVMISAMKQSIKASLPILNPLTKYTDFIKKEFNSQKGIAYCIDERKHIADWYNKGSDCLILIGPEGDFSPKEIELAIQNNYTGISLGNSRLRTETAATSACFAINMINRT
jgi:16S rRNA (uracil1498-N3)-methyltransferase